MMIDKGIQGAEDPAAAGTEGGRRPTGVSVAAESKVSPGGVPIELNGKGSQSNPQVVESPVRRRFTKAYKNDILQQLAACTQDAQVGQILRREGLYSSIVSNWRQRDKRGRLDTKDIAKQVVKTPAPDARLPQLQRENARLKARLQQAELILEIQKKASEILGISLKTLDNEGID
jgi:transposase-like protein